MGPGGPGAQVEGLLATRQVTGVETGGLGTTSPPARQHEETNGVAVVSQQEQDLYTKVTVYYSHRHLQLGSCRLGKYKYYENIQLQGILFDIFPSKFSSFSLSPHGNVKKVYLC